ncbi:MAG: AAA family ATPase [Bacteroidales bacterium]|nr:AAA family ATPase [Bacteroidales bacterium]
MAKIYLHNVDVTEDVKNSVLLLMENLKKELSPYDGEIWVIPNVDTHIATGLHDIDLLLIGYINDYIIDEICGLKSISFESFCTTIEIKSHSAKGVFRQGTSLYVRYGSEEKNVTQQSDAQKFTLMKMFRDILQLRTPFITNLIWLTGIKYDDFRDTIGLTNSNIITADVTIDNLFSSIGRQVSLKDHGFVDAFKGWSADEIASVASIFCAKSEGADSLTLRRLNLLQKETFLLSDIESNKDPIIVLSGHAGTGKTIMLLQAAQNLCNKGKKCLFLTYNNALISDLKRTMSFIPGAISELKLESVHSFMLSYLYRFGLWNDSNDLATDFIPEMIIFNRIKSNYDVLNQEYEYVFVDEAQDWEKPIPEVLKYIFRKAQLVIADGIDQFMRSSDQTDWGEPIVPPLNLCLRQRRNLTIFVKTFASKLGVSWNIIPNNHILGGRVIITEVYGPELHAKLLEDGKEYGCTPYDLMLLASNSLIEDGRFKHAKTYQSYKIPFYDGIDKKNRTRIYNEENAERRECRIYTYESCRGLEAWTTVCLRFDELFTHPHPHDYSEIEYPLARKYMLTLWTLIPLTRAIDTLVIVVRKDSDISKLLKEIANENPDFVTYK